MDTSLFILKPIEFFIEKSNTDLIFTLNDKEFQSTYGCTVTVLAQSDDKVLICVDSNHYVGNESIAYAMTRVCNMIMDARLRAHIMFTSRINH